MRRVLEKSLGLGWQVEEVDSAEKGLEILVEKREKFDIAVFDENYGTCGKIRGTDAIRQCRAAGAYHLPRRTFGVLCTEMGVLVFVVATYVVAGSSVVDQSTLSEPHQICYLPLCR